MIKFLSTLLLFVSTNVCAQWQDELAIRKLMAAQEKDWNLGNITGFMQGYWKSDSLLFVGKNGPTYGWQQTLDNYKKGYPDTATMGQLHFDILQIQPLSSSYCFVLGKWFLKRLKGDVGGAFTLLFRKFKDGWKIVADHSS
jgi:ketosteroid isomerase-like protein